jgi:hypothetical protein
MSKDKAESLCINLRRIRRRRCLIRGRRDSNILSIEMILIKIINTNLLRMNPRYNTPWEKGEYHQSNVGMLGMQRRSLVQGFPSQKGQSEDHAQNPRGYNSIRHGKNLWRFR